MGFGIARAFAQTGARVAIDGRTLDRLEGTLTKLEAMGVKAMAVPCDVRNPQAVEQAFEQVEQTIGLLALYSLVTLAAQQLFSTGQIYRRCLVSPNRRLRSPTPSPACAARCGATGIFHASHSEADMVKIPRPLIDRFIDSLCYAA